MIKSLWEEGGPLCHIQEMAQRLGWDILDDDIVVEYAGSAISGIDVGEEYNKKWQSPKGTVKYNKEAFIIVKNLSRSPVIPSEPNPDLKAHHEQINSSPDSGNDTDTDSSSS